MLIGSNIIIEYNGFDHYWTYLHDNSNKSQNLM